MKAHTIFLALSAVLAASLLSCGAATEEKEFGALPDQKSFIDNKVSLYVERRCGGLDCHGQVGRPLRLYGDFGLRLKPTEDGSRSPDGTTADEQAANYQALIGLEPEGLSKCYEEGKELDPAEAQDGIGGCQPETYSTLQLVKKPLSIEGGGIRHKGGPVMRISADDPGWRCLFGWISGHGFKADCEKGSALQ
jgi:hypothetical protein